MLGERTYDGKENSWYKGVDFHCLNLIRALGRILSLRGGNLASEWSGALFSHVRFHLLGRCFDPEGINDLIWGSFNLQATKDVAQAVVGSDIQGKSQCQVEVEQVFLKHNRTQFWVDLKLGMTKKQLDNHKRKCIAQAKLAEGLERP